MFRTFRIVPNSSESQCSVCLLFGLSDGPSAFCTIRSISGSRSNLRVKGHMFVTVQLSRITTSAAGFGNEQQIVRG